MAFAGDERVEVRRCRIAERGELVVRLLARGLADAAVIDACMRDPLFDYVDDHLDPAAPLRQDEAGKLTDAGLAAFGRARWRALCERCFCPVSPATIGSRALESACSQCGARLDGATVLVERRGLCRKTIKGCYINAVKARLRRVSLDEGAEVRAARERLLEMFRAATERGDLGVAVRAQRELSRMLGLRRRMSDERMGGDLGERLAEQLTTMTDMTRIMGGAGDSDLTSRPRPPDLVTMKGDDDDDDDGG